MQVIKAGANHLTKSEMADQLDTLIRQEEEPLELHRRLSFHQVPLEGKGLLPPKQPLVKFAPKLTNRQEQDGESEGGYMSDPTPLRSDSDMKRLFE